MPSSAPLLVLLAGPNGAGKSTFHDLHLAGIGLPFVNADAIAREHFGNRAATKARQAAALATERRLEFVRDRRSFVFETVLSDPVGDKVGFCERAVERGYFVDAHFIGLNSPALSQARVVQRVTQGGHDVPDEKLENRYPRTLENLRRLVPVAGRLTVYDNSELDRPFRPVACFRGDHLAEFSSEIPGWLEFLDLPSLVTPDTTSLP